MKYLWLALLLCSTTAAAQVLAPKRLAITPESRLQLDSMARLSVANHAEQAACVTTAVKRDSVYVIMEIKPARNIAAADSIGVSFQGPPCEPNQPLIHSHIMGDVDRPSAVDYHMAAQLGVFNLLVSVKADSAWKLRAYP